MLGFPCMSHCHKFSLGYDVAASYQNLWTVKLDKSNDLTTAK